MRGRIFPAALAVSLVIAGLMHLALTGDHLAESMLLGAGFVLAGLAQIVLGSLALGAPRPPYAAIATLNATLVALFILHVTVGLPLPDATITDDTPRGLFGALEAVDPPGVATKAAELLGVALALHLRRERATAAEPASTRRAA